MHQVWYARVCLGQLQPRKTSHPTAGTIDPQRRAVKHQLAVDIYQPRPGLCFRQLHQFGHIGKTCFAYFCRHPELAFVRIGKREVEQVSLEFELHIAECPLRHRITHVMANPVWQDQRKVTVHPAAIAAAQSALQVQNTRKTCIPLCRGSPAGDNRRRLTGAPAGLRAALSVCIGKYHVAQLQIDFGTGDLPLRIGR